MINHEILGVESTEPPFTIDVGNETEEPEPEPETTPEPTPEPEPEPEPEPVTSDLAAVITCLNDNDATLYGAYWKRDVKNQKEIFGDSIDQVNYIECDSNVEEGQPQLCEDAGITTYPSWVIDGETYEGMQSLEELAEITSCT